MSTITIDTDDLVEVADRLLKFRSAPDAGRPALTHVHVAPTAEGLRWTATDSYRMGCLHRGATDLEAGVLIEAGVIDFGVRAATRSEVETITFEVDDDLVTLVLPELRVPRRRRELEYPDVDQFLDEAPDHTLTRLRARGENLRAALHATVTFNDAYRHESGQPVALRTVDDGTLQVISHWPDAPDTHAFIPVETDGPVDAVVNASYLHDLIDAIGANDVTLYIGAPTEPLRVRTEEGFRGILMPIHLGQPDLERRIAGWLGMDHGDLYVDDDGWIPITTVEDTAIWVHLMDNGDPFRRRSTVRFSTVLAEEIACTPELLGEINDLNKRATMCRVLHADETVHVAAEALLDTLDHEEIDHVCRELDHHVQMFGPLIEAVHRS